jgi:VanZ family protein
VTLLVPLLATALVAITIYWLGSGQFGRNQTQAWIDRLRRFPAIQEFLNAQHGRIRASAHYVEFGGLYLVLYWLWDAALGAGMFLFEWWPAVVLWVVCAIAAYLDELHQLTSGTRQFRRVDFLHSCCGITIAMGVIYTQEFVRLLLL